ncbi:PREDICTED: serine/threonine-protein kinase PLK1 [Papilio polytes]|uniref:serine/threonine-protein kinase PLK1 n=1 Tax=Papilio polytes TaxID=76194 RepID=UPI000676B038|nr:PREDICTED: serine/threonine-protein kinase PLK1 [Papilio polytes]
MTSIKEDEKKEIPEIIQDPQTKSTYHRLRFFGKGGFAKCYEIQDMATNQVYAGKIVSKKLMVKSSQKEKMAQEISIHRSLQHKHVVGFHSFFEDSLNIYIVLELCKRRSMMELHKRRKAITEPETRFYMRQILLGVQYLHSRRIIHRDLKLGNLFLDDDLCVKIGDFGLAAKIEYEGERKQTLCGTPNYIAPEILTKKGHSFEVDIWSLGCIMYTLLVGKPPFETSTLKDTYKRIKQCEYRVPTTLRKPATSLCDESVGVMFNDTTKLIMLANGVNVHYIDRHSSEKYMTMTDYPAELDKKMKLLSYFRRYMTEHLMKAGASVQVRESDGLSRLPHLHQWFRTTLAVIMYLTNGTLQINFQDHTKIILCPLMQAVTYIDVEKNFRTFRFSTIEEHGCDKKLYTNLTYALEKINSVLSTKLC